MADGGVVVRSKRRSKQWTWRAGEVNNPIHLPLRREGMDGFWDGGFSIGGMVGNRRLETGLDRPGSGGKSEVGPNRWVQTCGVAANRTNAIDA